MVIILQIFEVNCFFFLLSVLIYNLNYLIDDIIEGYFKREGYFMMWIKIFV